MSLGQNIRNGFYIGTSLALFLALSRGVQTPEFIELISPLSSLPFAASFAIGLLLIILVITSPIWIVTLFPRDWLPQPEAVLGMWGICNAALPLFPFLSEWVLWQYL